MTEDPLVLLPFAAGRVTALPVSVVLAGEEQAFKLGFGARQEPRDSLNSGTERLLDSKQLGELLGVNDTLVEQMAKDGRLPSIRIGRLLRFEPALCKARLRVTDGGPV